MTVENLSNDKSRDLHVMSAPINLSETKSLYQQCHRYKQVQINHFFQVSFLFLFLQISLS